MQVIYINSLSYLHMERRKVKAIRIVKHLLEKPGGEWTRYGLAKASGCSWQWAIELLGKLEERGLVSGTKVVDPMALLRYAASVAPPPTRTVECYHTRPVNLIRSSKVDYAITTTYAENEFTHLLFKTRCDVYVSEATMNLLWRRVADEGLLGRGNLRLMIPADPRVISEASLVHGIRIVSREQLMVDLMREGGVCVQAVEEMVGRHAVS